MGCKSSPCFNEDEKLYEDNDNFKTQVNDPLHIAKHSNKDNFSEKGRTHSVSNFPHSSNVSEQRLLERAMSPMLVESTHRNKNEETEVTIQDKDFCQKLLDEFNECRTNPKIYADKVLKHMQFIKPNPSITDNVQGNNFIYDNDTYPGPKILLNQGWNKLSKFAEILKKMSPLKPLIFNQNLCLSIPNDKTEWTKKDNFMKQIIDKKHELGKSKVAFHFDIGYANAEISAMLQLVDDNNAFKGMRRKNILNEDAIQIGISNRLEGHKNCTYLLFLKASGGTTSTNSRDISDNN